MGRTKNEDYSGNVANNLHVISDILSRSYHREIMNSNIFIQMMKHKSKYV